ncbi:hypothetical protein Tco_0581435 [Tanacetum coccineum]
MIHYVKCKRKDVPCESPPAWRDGMRPSTKSDDHGGVPRFERPYHEGFGAFAWRIPILVNVSKIVLRHSKLFEGFKVQLGEDLIQARRGGLRSWRLRCEKLLMLHILMQDQRSNSLVRRVVLGALDPTGS